LLWYSSIDSSFYVFIKGGEDLSLSIPPIGRKVWEETNSFFIAIEIASFKGYRFKNLEPTSPLVGGGVDS